VTKFEVIRSVEQKEAVS